VRIIKNKIKTNKQLRRIILKLKRRGERIAFTNGCFDILHYGHVAYLQKAKGLADILLVAVNSDKSVKRIKGRKRPVINLKDRMRTVAALESVDFVTSFSQDTPFVLIKLLKPDILIKGGDWDSHKIIGRRIVQSYGGRAISLPYIKGKSSSQIIKKIGKIF
jgi:D-beta-D-heptose 7-phosphate kinase/D-beta-D-heptose 1-phosphate adenosyltransferase